MTANEYGKSKQTLDTHAHTTSKTEIYLHSFNSYFFLAVLAFVAVLVLSVLLNFFFVSEFINVDVRSEIHFFFQNWFQCAVEVVFEILPLWILHIISYIVVYFGPLKNGLSLGFRSLLFPFTLKQCCKLIQTTVVSSIGHAVIIRLNRCNFIPRLSKLKKKRPSKAWILFDHSNQFFFIALIAAGIHACNHYTSKTLNLMTFSLSLSPPLPVVLCR